MEPPRTAEDAFRQARARWDADDEEGAERTLQAYLAANPEKREWLMETLKRWREEKAARILPARCMRCGGAAAYQGEKTLHEGTRFGVLGDIGELLVARLRLHMYACGACGHVEFATRPLPPVA